MIGRRLASAGLAVAALLAVAAPASGRSAEQVGPTITLDRQAVPAGERVVVTLAGWSAPAVTLSVCGNLAVRGSIDCNMVGSQGVGMARNGPPTRSELVVTTPAVPCPCVVRAASSGQDEVATAPIDLVGAPTGPLVQAAAADATPLTVSMTVRRSPNGGLARVRAALGGPTDYVVTISVRNRTAVPLDGLRLTVGAGRWTTEDLVSLDLAGPVSLDPEQTWQRAVRARVPAPAVGPLVWRVSALGAGPPAHAERVVRTVPWALVLLTGLLAGDLVALAQRRVSSRRYRPARALAVPAGEIPRLAR